MKWFLAPALVTLRKQLKALYPDRDIASDGSIGDPRHKARKSDHNPNSYGAVCAIDVDEDLSPGHDASTLVQALQASRDERINYIIYEGMITVKGDITRWKKYSGTNPHSHHFHLSLHQVRRLWNDAREFDLSRNVAQPLPVPPSYKLNDRGEAIRRIQSKLVKSGFEVAIDGDFGPKTHKAVLQFQKVVMGDKRPDGIVGPKTLKALGL